MLPSARAGVCDKGRWVERENGLVAGHGAAHDGGDRGTTTTG